VLELHGLSSHNHGSGCGAASHHHTRVQFDMTAIRREIIPVSIQSRCAFHNLLQIQFQSSRRWSVQTSVARVASNAKLRPYRTITTRPETQNYRKSSECRRFMISKYHQYSKDQIQRPDPEVDIIAASQRARSRLGAEGAEGEQSVTTV
jgi:hypothetical protein